MGTIAKTIGGRSDVLGVARAKLTGEGSHALGVLNTSNYLAIGGMRQLSQEIWGRKVAVAFEDLGEDYGYYHHSEDPNRIVINRRSNTNDREDVAVLAAGAAHEGQHRYDRTFQGVTSEYSAHRSGAAVYLNLMHGLGLKGNDRLMQSIAAGLMSEQSKQTNTGPVDHWKLTADGGLAFTGQGFLQNEDGDYITEDNTIVPAEEFDPDNPGNVVGAKGIETGLLNILNDGGTSGQSYDSFSDEQKQAAQGLMTGAGLGYVLRGDGTDTLANRFWDENVVNGQTIGTSMLEGYDLPGASSSGSISSQIPGLFARIGLGQVSGRIDEIANGLEHNPASIWDRIAGPRTQQQERPGLFGRIGNAWNRLWGNEPEIANDQYVNAIRVAENPAEVVEFWQDVMNPEVAAEYQDIDGSSPQCNRFVCGTIRNQFGQEVLDHIFPNGQQYANLMALELANSENVVRLDANNVDDLRYIQNLANEGYLILMAYQNPDWTEGSSPAGGAGLSGHLAFVAPENVELFSLAFNSSNWATGLNGTSGMGLNFGQHGPVMAQAGTYTGFTPMTLATNGWASPRTRPNALSQIGFYLVNGN